MRATFKDCVAVLNWGIASRLFLFLFQVVSNNVIPDHTGSMEDVFMRRYRHPPHHPLVEAALGGFDNWDSEHFIFIAEQGYGIHEQSMAFFPLFPSLLWMLSQTLFRPLLLLLSLRSVLLITGFTLNLILFPFAVLSLYLLTLRVFKNHHFALLTVSLFCINPASVFMSSLYTECLFSLLTFSGLLSLECGYSWPATLLFMLATATRSNGIVLCGYIGYRCLHLVYNLLTTDSLFTESLFLIVNAGLQCVLIVSPLALFQYYGYQLYCTPKDDISLPIWCSWTLPMPYSYIQDHYWNNGFMRYFQLKQIPNFLIAAPMIILSSCCIVKYFRAPHKGTSNNETIESVHMRPYVVCLTFLVVFGTFFMNVQVITRFICSASPLVYWFSASVLLASHKPFKLTEYKEADFPGARNMARLTLKTVFNHPGLTSGKLIIIYFILYVLLGLVLHCNFFPWT